MSTNDTTANAIEQQPPKTLMDVLSVLVTNLPDRFASMCDYASATALRNTSTLSLSLCVSLCGCVLSACALHASVHEATNVCA